MTLELDEIIQGNNVTVMLGWPDECIDLTVTSPPYDDLRTYSGYSWDFEALAGQLWRVTKPGGVVVWVVNDSTVDGSETGTSFKQALYFMGLGFRLHDTMIWNKKSTAVYDPRNKRCKSVFEYMFVFSKGSPKTFNEILDVPVKIPGKKNTSGTRTKPNGDKRHYPVYYSKDKQARSNIWVYKTGNNISTKDKDAMKHPAIFPEQLAHDHIISWSNPGDVVLDCFAGSGTVPKMCVLTDRHFVGIDISPEYVALAQRRVAAVKAQPRLFTWDLEPANQQPEVEPV